MDTYYHFLCKVSELYLGDIVLCEGMEGQSFSTGVVTKLNYYYVEVTQTYYTGTIKNGQPIMADCKIKYFPPLKLLVYQGKRPSAPPPLELLVYQGERPSGPICIDPHAADRERIAWHFRRGRTSSSVEWAALKNVHIAGW
jgi:hypothetical protein